MSAVHGAPWYNKFLMHFKKEYTGTMYPKDAADVDVGYKYVSALLPR